MGFFLHGNITLTRRSSRAGVRAHGSQAATELPPRAWLRRGMGTKAQAGKHLHGAPSPPTPHAGLLAQCSTQTPDSTTMLEAGSSVSQSLKPRVMLGRAKIRTDPTSASDFQSPGGGGAHSQCFIALRSEKYLFFS